MPCCSVKGCTRKAEFRVILYDVYRDGSVFFEEDYTCPRLCAQHLRENEEGAKSNNGVEIPHTVEHGFRITNLADVPEPQPTDLRRARGCVLYPFTNQNLAQGFTIYVPLD